MPSKDLLDFPALVKPIAGDNPAGNRADYSAAEAQLEILRKGSDPQFQPGHPDYKPKQDPNWAKIVQDTTALLTNRCKHLQAATRLAEALAVIDGIPGARDGLKLLRLLVTECADRIHPDDAGIRAGKLNWLGLVDSGAWYPTKIRNAPLFGTLSWQTSQAGGADVLAAIRAVPDDKYRDLMDDLTLARTELEQLTTGVSAGLEKDDLPNLGEIDRALNDCLALVQRGQQERPVAVTESAAPNAAGQPAPKPVVTRESIYGEVERLADKLEELEPHSPVPQLLRKIVTLQPLKFHELVAELTRDQKVLDFLKPVKPAQ